MNPNGVAMPILEICIAAHNGDSSALAALLESRDWVANAIDPVTRCTPLHHAVIGGHLNCVRLLLAHPRINVNAAGETVLTSDTPLHLAVTSTATDALAIARLLLARGADIAAVSRSETPFTKACKSGSRKMVSLLFHQRTHALVVGNRWADASPPHLAAVNGGNHPVLDLLLSFDSIFQLSIPPGDQYSLVKATIATSSFDIFAALMARFQRDMSDTVANYGEMLIADSLYNGEFLQLLLTHGCKPYHAAAGSGRMLLDHHVLTRAFEISGKLLQLIMKFVPANIIKAHDAADLFKMALASRPEPAGTVAILLDAGFTTRTSPIKVFSLNDTLLDPFVSHFMAICRFTEPQMSVVSLAIARIGAMSQLREIILSLLQHGASLRDADAQRLMFCPLTLLALKSLNNTEYTTLLLELIDDNVSGGVSLNYRMVASRFQCADVVVAAAVAGNTTVLARLFASAAASVVNVKHLLWDLGCFACRHRDLCRSAAPSAVAIGVQLRRNIDAAIGRATLFVIGCARKCRQLQTYCSRITRVLEAASVGGRDAEGEPIWARVAGSFDAPDRLMHLCRLEIRNRLQSDTDQAALNEKIESLNIPSLVKRYLKFEW